MQPAPILYILYVWQVMTFEMLALDKEFLITCAGTSVFQHILNGISWVLLTRGRCA